MQRRTLGRSGIEVAAIGLGCLTIGGPFSIRDIPIGRSTVDDAESIRALHRALDLGGNFFDTSDMYGCGHSEHLLGQAFADRREQVVICTKFGRVPDEQTRTIIGVDASPEYIRQACEASLRRLQTDYIDLYQFHLPTYDLARAVEVRETLEQLVSEGKIRSYGWSTDDLDCARVFAEGKHCSAIQHDLNLFQDAEPMLALCQEYHMASIARRPLAIGILTGKLTADTHFPNDDVRRDWDLANGPQAQQLQQLSALRDVLVRDGRTPAQAALGWVLSRSPITVPIPGFRTIEQVEENLGALVTGPLSEAEMSEIQAILSA